MKVTYSGPHPTVYIAENESLGNETGEDGLPVIRQGVPVEVPDELAKRLLEQDTWAAATAPKSSAAKTPAATPTPGA